LEQLQRKLAELTEADSKRARAEEELRASEERYRQLFERNLAGVYRVTLDGRLLDCNEALARIFGYASRAEALQQSAVNLHPTPEDRQAFLEAVRETGILVNHEALGRRKDGSTFWLLENASLVADQAGKPTQIEGTLIDITDRKQMEEELRSSEQRQAMILRSLPVAVYTARVPSEFDASWFSDSVRRVTGFDASRFVESPAFWSGRIHPEDRERVVRDYQSVLSAGEVSLEYRWRAADDAYRWFSDRAVLVGEGDGPERAVIGTLVDFTEQKEAEDALRRSEQDYRGLFEGAHDAIVVFEPDDETVLDVNQRACEVYGFDRDEFIGMSLESISKDVGTGKQRIRETLERGVNQHFETTQKRKDGSEIMLEVNAARVEYQGRPAILSINRDITERRQLEAELRHAQRMEAIGRLAGGVAHDFNNLLQAILANVAALRLAQKDAGPEEQRALWRIEDLVESGAAATRRLLLFARKEEPQREILDLNEVLVESATLLRGLVRENIQFQVETCDEPVSAEADRGQLGQVLANLVVNACDAMPDGGRLVMRCGFQNEAEVFLEVTDTGVGIPEDARGKVFEPFFTTKESDKGTGLGLSVVRAIIESFDGHIDVDSREGQGSTFRVVLGRRQWPAATASREVESAVSQGRGERVLIVEDDPRSRDALSQVLTKGGYLVAVATTAEEAEQVCAVGRFDVVITDLVLPGSRGDQLARTLQDLKPDLPVIIMSGYAELGDLRSISGLPNVRYLEKPVRLERLAAEVRTALDGRSSEDGRREDEP
jgi:PAS domain S-box-containing protein